MSQFGVILVCIFPHFDWIRRDTPYLYIFGLNAGYIKNHSKFNPFVPNAPFLYPLKTLSEKLTIFWCFRRIEKGCIGNEWVKPNSSFQILSMQIHGQFYQTFPWQCFMNLWQCFTLGDSALCVLWTYPVCNYMFKVNNRSNRTRCFKICSKLTIKIPEQTHCRRPGVFIVSFEHISHLALVFLLLTLSS